MSDQSKRIRDLSGKVFGTWSVIKRLPGYPAKYRCRCDCGTEALVLHGNLQSGASQGCRECAHKKVGASIRKWREENKWAYHRWLSLRGRMCNEWSDSLDAFAEGVVAEIGPPPKRHSVLGTLRPGTIGPGNISWSRGRVRKGAELLSVNGVTGYSLRGLAEQLGVSRERARQLLARRPCSKCGLPTPRGIGVCWRCSPPAHGKRLKYLDQMLDGRIHEVKVESKEIARRMQAQLHNAARVRGVKVKTRRVHGFLVIQAVRE